MKALLVGKEPGTELGFQYVQEEPYDAVVIGSLEPGQLLRFREEAVLAALAAHKLEPKRLQPVQKQADTAPWLFLLEAKKDARPGLIWLPPLVLYTDEGEPTPALREIYREVTV